MMSTEIARTPPTSTKRTCPSCAASARDALPIRYGMVSAWVLQQARRGEVVLGPINHGRNEPRLLCSHCGHRFAAPRADLDRFGRPLANALPRADATPAASRTPRTAATPSPQLEGAQHSTMVPWSAESKGERDERRGRDEAPMSLGQTPRREVLEVASLRQAA